MFRSPARPFRSCRDRAVVAAIAQLPRQRRARTLPYRTCRHGGHLKEPRTRENQPLVLLLIFVPLETFPTQANDNFTTQRVTLWPATAYSIPVPILISYHYGRNSTAVLFTSYPCKPSALSLHRTTFSIICSVLFHSGLLRTRPDPSWTRLGIRDASTTLIDPSCATISAFRGCLRFEKLDILLLP